MEENELLNILATCGHWQEGIPVARENEALPVIREAISARDLLQIKVARDDLIFCFKDPVTSRGAANELLEHIATQTNESPLKALLDQLRLADNERDDRLPRSEGSGRMLD